MTLKYKPKIIFPLSTLKFKFKLIQYKMAYRISRLTNDEK